MKPINRSLLALQLIPATFICYLMMELLVSLAGLPIWPHPALAILIVLGTVALWQAGRAVKAVKRRRATWLNPAQAPYVVYTTQAVAYWSIYMLGYLIAQVLILFRLSETELPQRVGWRVGLVMLCTIVLLFVSLLVEKWCQIDLNDPDKKDRHQQIDPSLFNVDPAPTSGISSSRSLTPDTESFI